MFQPYEIFIGLRYTRAKRRNHFISFISAISILGIALGVTALITVLSVMNGFENELRQRILSMASHATIASYSGGLNGWQQIAATANAHPRVLGTAPYVEGQVMMVNGRQVSGALIRGIEPALEPQVSDVGEKMQVGQLESLRAGEYGIVLGAELAQFLGVFSGDKLMLVMPDAQITPVGVLPRVKRFTVTGIYKVGMYEYDRSMAFMHIQDAAKLMKLDAGVTGVRLKLDDMFAARSVTRQLIASLPEDLWVSDWTYKHANFFRAIKTEKTVMFVILALIVAVAAFNIVSTLIMVVTDKQADIAILRTLGASPRSILWIFLVQGSIIGWFGTMLGVVFGIALSLNAPEFIAWVETVMEMKFLSPDVYYISDLPSDLKTTDVIRVALLSFFLTMVATLYPALNASKTQPAEALRYE